MLASPMLKRTLATLLLLSAPALAQTRVPDCTADVVVAQREGLKLDVTYRCRSTTTLQFVADGDRVVRRVTTFRDGANREPTPSSNAWKVEPVAGAVTARYRFDLTGYARAVDSNSAAVQRGDGVLSLLSGWLLEPRGFGANPVIDIRASVPQGLVFATGLPKVGDAWRLAGTNVRFAGYTAIGKLHYEEIAVPAPGSLRAGAKRENGTVRLALLDGFSDSGRADIVEWVKSTAVAESNYWEGFTARQMLLGLIPAAGRGGVGFGRTVPGGGETVMMEVGVQVDRERLFRDWVLVHEWIHTGMPYLRGRATWFMEGAATYVEPIIRARAGWKTEAEVWKEWTNDMPQGAGAFAVGLANASGRQNYWSGAIFMLLADIEFRRTTDGRMGLEDCLKGALWQGFGGSIRAGLEEYADACDKATGTKVMSGLVDKHFNNEQPLDLAKLWSDLGVEKGGLLNDDAPLAKWRKMIVMGVRPTQRVLRPWES